MKNSFERTKPSKSGEQYWARFSANLIALGSKSRIVSRWTEYPERWSGAFNPQWEKERRSILTLITSLVITLGSTVKILRFIPVHILNLFYKLWKS